MPDEKALENEIARAVEADLSRPTAPSATRLRPVADNGDPMDRWLKLGERIHNDAVDRLRQSRDRYEQIHADVVDRLKQLHELKASIEQDEALLRGVRRRLGYGS